jgi:hypothetical protein
MPREAKLEVGAMGRKKLLPAAVASSYSTKDAAILTALRD